MKGAPNRSGLAEVRRLDGLANALRRKRRSGGSAISFDVFWPGIRGLLFASAIVLLGVQALDPASAKAPDGLFVFFLMILPWAGALLHPRPPSEWEALRMPSRRELLAARLLKALPWHLAACVAWGLFAAVKAFSIGMEPGPQVMGLAVAVGVMPLLLGAALLWTRSGTDAPDLGCGVRSALHTVAFVFMSVLVVRRSIRGWTSFDFRDLLAVLTLALVTAMFLWCAVSNARDWKRLRRLEPWRRTPYGTVIVGAFVAVLKIAGVFFVIEVLLLDTGFGRLAEHGIILGLSFGAAALLLLPLLVIQSLRRFETVQVEDSPELSGPPITPVPQPRSATRSFLDSDPMSVPIASWDNQDPVRSGGGYWRAAWVRNSLSKRPIWRHWIANLPKFGPGKRVLVLALLPLAWAVRLIHYLFFARGLVIAFGVVLIAGQKGDLSGTGWFPFAALLVPHMFGADASERTYLLGSNLREGRIHDLRAYLLTCALPSLVVGLLTLPLADPYWGPRALVLFAAMLLFRLGWTGYGRWNSWPGRAGTAAFLALATLVAMTVIGLLSSRGRTLICTNPYPVAAIAAVVGAIGLAIHLANLSEDRLREEQFTQWSGTAADDD